MRNQNRLNRMNVKQTIVSWLMLLLLAITSGCYTTTHTVGLNPWPVPDPSQKRQGTLGLKFADTRTDKTKIGHLGGRIGPNPDLVVSGGLDTALAEIFKRTLEEAGYTVVAGAHPTLEGE